MYSVVEEVLLTCPFAAGITQLRKAIATQMMLADDEQQLLTNHKMLLIDAKACSVNAIDGTGCSGTMLYRNKLKYTL